MKKSGKKIALIIALVIVLIFAALFIMYYPVIFQRGNPIPYLKAASKLGDDIAFVEVDVDDEYDKFYISKKDAQEEFLSFVEDSTGAEFLEQAGSGFIFKDIDENFVVENEIYFSRYYVWSVPLNSLK